MLYLLKTLNYYKIGYSHNESSLKNRMRSYTTHNPILELVGIKDGGREDEKAYHNSFSQYEGTGEWFIVPEEIIKIIKKDFVPTGLNKPHKMCGSERKKYYKYKRKKGCIIQVVGKKEIARFNTIKEASQKTGWSYNSIYYAVINHLPFKGCMWIREK